MELSRRAFVGGVGAAAAGLALGVGPTRRAVAAEDSENIRQVWLPVGTAPILSKSFASGAGGNEAWLFTTMLPVGSYPLRSGYSVYDMWYLWVWTHDSPRMFLWSAPQPEGPWTPRGNGVPGQPPETLFVGPPGPMRSWNKPGHFSSGDVAWDAVNRRFISTPHTQLYVAESGKAEVTQNSLVMESFDGRSWHFISNDDGGSTIPGDARLVCGPKMTADSIATTYGRLLRDLDGNLIRHNGRYWWVHRAHRHDAPLLGLINQPSLYSVALSSAASLSAGRWDRYTTSLFTPAGPYGPESISGFGSFIRANGKVSITYAPGPGEGFGSRNFLNVSSGADPTTGYTGFGQPVPLARTEPTTLLSEQAGYIIRKPGTDEQYQVVATTRVGVNTGSSIWLYKAPF